MSRIRTIKPELFKHDELFDAEINHKLPLRVAFMGLFTCCDRDGRFKWHPRRLKTDILPYDDVDPEQVFNILAQYGFIKKYEYQGQFYGYIPSWHKHQHVNNRESKSTLPAPHNENFTTEIIQSNSTNPTLVTEPTIMTETKIPSEEIQSKTQVTELIKPQEISTINMPTIQSTNPTLVTEPTIMTTTKTPPEEVQSKLQVTQPIKSLETIKTNMPIMQPVNHVNQIFNHWKIIMDHPEAKLDPQRTELIKKALQLGYDVTLICYAITGCSLTPYNMGDNDRGERYDGLHIILRDANQIDRFIRHYHQPPRPPTGDKRTQNNIKNIQRWLAKKQEEMTICEAK